MDGGHSIDDVVSNTQAIVRKQVKATAMKSLEKSSVKGKEVI